MSESTEPTQHPPVKDHLSVATLPPVGDTGGWLAALPDYNNPVWHASVRVVSDGTSETGSVGHRVGELADRASESATERARRIGEEWAATAFLLVDGLTFPDDGFDWDYPELDERVAS